ARRFGAGTVVCAGMAAIAAGLVIRPYIGSTAQEDQESLWGFDVAADGDGTVLTHHFRMGKATAGIHKIVKDMDEQERAQFVTDWTAKLAQDLDETLDRIKVVIEKQ
ncbi:hypothetical protein ABTZ98_30550, partial [Streptomyces bacillaris]